MSELWASSCELSRIISPHDNRIVIGALRPKMFETSKIRKIDAAKIAREPSIVKANVLYNDKNTPTSENGSKTAIIQ